MDETSSVGILGIGSFVPPHVRTNEYWAGRLRKRDDGARQRDILEVERTAQGGRSEMPAHLADAMKELGDDPWRGARTRHVMSDEMTASDMEAEAVRRAMRQARVRPDEVDLVLVHSLLPDQINPSDGPAIVAKCEMVNATAFALDVGCASVPPQLVVATALVRSGMYKRIVIVCSAASSRFLDYTEPSSIVFGDGAAAAVIGRVPGGYGIMGHWTRTNGALRDGVALAPVIDGKPERRWDRCTGPVRLTSFDVAQGKHAGVFAGELCREACMRALDAAKLQIDDIALYVGAQSQGWFVGACRRALGLPRDKVIDTFPEIANIGAAAVLFNLLRAHETGRIRTGDDVLMYSPGAGFTQAAAVYRWLAPGEA